MNGLSNPADNRKEEVLNVIKKSLNMYVEYVLLSGNIKNCSIKQVRWLAVQFNGGWLSFVFFYIKGNGRRNEITRRIGKREKEWRIH